MKQIKDLLASIDFIEAYGDLNSEIDNIQYDSRRCSKNSLFVAIKGFESDGHKYIGKAIELGATIIVCEELPEDEIDDVCFVHVENSRRALAEISHCFYDYPSENMKIIGVTGTNGKTSITFILRDILKEAGFKTAVIGTTGIFIEDDKIPATHTTPESLEICKMMQEMTLREIDYVVMEISSHSLKLNRVYGIDFSVALFTNLTRDHLDFHPDFEDYANSKKLLFDTLGDNAIAIVNADDEMANYMIKSSMARDISYLGYSDDADIRISAAESGLDGIKYNIDFAQDNEELNVESQLLADFNIFNTSIAASAAYKLGVDFKDILSGLKKTSGAPGRMEIVRLKNDAIGIVDYSHTPDALEKALKSCKDVLKNSADSGRLISVFGCGGDRDKGKRPIMGKISTSIADKSIVTSDNPRTEEPGEIINDILEGIKKSSDYEVVENRAEAIKEACSQARKGDIILVAGKGHEDYQVLGKEKIYFSDIKELSKY